ncbi:MAG TPA: hypothetical protein O0X27_00165 [Methanocorpusculum sp.]|nr:hypothetical protein [Methanocorpusculum sp.]
MESIDPEKRILLLPKGLDLESCKFGTDFDVSNITGYLSDTLVDEADAVFVCAGLGGKMGEALPAIITQLSIALANPIFTILTIPARNEGARVSARAAAELEAIRKVASAAIIFDNETWIVRLEEERAAKLAESREILGEDGIVIREPSKLSVNEVHDELNELLTRRVELLLRAGEITENGIETAEVVLDAGEVLNTLIDTDIVSIGYAAEELPKKLLGFLNRFRMEKYLLEEGHKRTARIVNLAKRAVYEEVSIPCDLTTANKALVLITGPSNELSMKGFQTIRRWIDNSIKGLEMRAGDYPVKSTKDVGVIIVLAGIENVPRIAELNEIRVSYDEEVKKKYHTREDLFSEKQEPELRSATDKEIFEEGSVLSIGADPLSGYEVNLGYATSAMMGVAAASSIAYAGYEAGNSQYLTEDDSATDDAFFDNETEYPEEENQQYGEDESYSDDVFFDNETEYPEEENQQYGEDESSSDDDFFDDETEYPEEENQQYGEDGSSSDDDFFDDDTESQEEESGTDDVFLEDDEYVDTSGGHVPADASTSESTEEDVFEDNPVPAVPTPAPAAEAAVSAAASATATGAVAAGVATAGAAVVAGKVILPKTEKKTAKRKSDPQITVGGRKKQKTDLDSAIPLPKRNKQPDMVLEGQADLGKRKVLKEGMDRTSVGSSKRPKETDGRVSIGSGQRPKETDGIVSVGSGQRPKETDGNVSVGSKMRPKETDGTVSVGTRKRPKDDGGAVSVGAKRKPNDAGRAVSVGTKRKPKDDIGNVSVGTKRTPKEIGNTVKVVEKKPLQTDVWKTIRDAQKKRESSTEKSSGTSRNLKWM